MAGKRCGRQAGSAAASLWLVVLFSACGPRSAEDLSPGAGDAAASTSGRGFTLPECPGHWDSIPLHHGPTLLVPPTGLSISGPITNVPEFHDCQKLLVEGGRRYGPMAAVFAAYDLERLELRLDSLNAPRQGGNAPSGSLGPAGIRPDSGVPGAPTPVVTVDTTVTGVANVQALAGALILNLGETYVPLGIKPGFSCLYLWKTDDGLWHSGILWVDQAHQKCLEPAVPASLPNGELALYRDVAPGFMTESDYPAVARWDWDDKNRRQYIGIRCGRAWCEVGAKGLTRSSPYLAMATAATKAVRVRRIKGWYDEQFLALPAEAGTDFRTSRLKGTVIPDTSLKTRSLSDYAGQWQVAAYIALSDASPFYKKKFNLDAVPPASPLSEMNKLSFCFGTKDRCRVPPSSDPGSLSIDACQEDGGADLTTLERWWVRIDGRRGPPMYRCVTRVDHSDAGKPVEATARWRWLARDESVWKECLNGCCKVAEFETPH